MWSQVTCAATEPATEPSGTAPDAGAPETGGAEAAEGTSAGQSGEEGGTDGER